MNKSKMTDREAILILLQKELDHVTHWLDKKQHDPSYKHYWNGYICALKNIMVAIKLPEELETTLCNRYETPQEGLYSLHS